VHAYLKIKSYLYYQWSYIWKNYWNLVFFFPILNLFHYKISHFYRWKYFVGVWLEVHRWFIYRRLHRRIRSVGFPFVGDSPFHRYIGRKNKKTICQWFYRRNLRAKKKVSRLKYTDRVLFRRWYRDLPTATYRWYNCRWVFEIPTEYICL